MPVQEDFWPSLRALGENNGVSLDTLDLDCIVCNEPFQYRGRGDDDVGMPRRHRILPCGHILCYRCLFIYYETGQSRCPTCRTELMHNCGHPHLGITMPLTRLDKLPPILSQGGGMPRGCGSCFLLGLMDLFNRVLNRDPDIPEEVRGQYLGLSLKFPDVEYYSRDVTGPVMEIEPPTAVKELIDDIFNVAIEGKRENEVWVEADFSTMKIRVLHFKPELLSQGEETVPQAET